MDDVRERENKRRLGEPELDSVDSVEVNETNPGRSLLISELIQDWY